MEEVPEISAAGLEIVALMNGLAADPLGTSLMGAKRLEDVGRRGFWCVGRRGEKWLFEKHIDSIGERWNDGGVVRRRPSDRGMAGQRLRVISVWKGSIFRR